MVADRTATPPEALESWAFAVTSAAWNVSPRFMYGWRALNPNSSPSRLPMSSKDTVVHAKGSSSLGFEIDDMATLRPRCQGGCTRPLEDGTRTHLAGWLSSLL